MVRSMRSVPPCGGTTSSVNCSFTSRVQAWFPVVTGSDAHGPDDIGRRFTWFTVQDGSVAEIKMALAGRDDRKAEC